MGLATSAKSAASTSRVPASILLLFLFDFVTEVKADFPPSSFVIASFNDSLNSWFSFRSLGDKTGQNYARIYSTALQLTPDTGNNRFSDIKFNASGKIMLKNTYRLWRETKSSANRSTQVASFNSSFVVNSLRQDETGGEGLAFVVSNSEDLPENSYGMYLGLCNNDSNGNPNNGVFAVEIDTLKSGSFDLDSNHIGVNVNSIYSLRSESLNSTNISVKAGEDFCVSIFYDGDWRTLSVYVNPGSFSLPNQTLILNMSLDLSLYLSNEVYFGFSGSTGRYTELNCVRSWAFSIEEFPEKSKKPLIIGLAVGSGFLLVVLMSGTAFLVFKWRQKRRLKKSPRVLERILTDMTAGPRKFKLRELKKATNNFDKNRRLGEGGFGAVFLGFLVNKTPVAVKRIAENSNQGEHEFMTEVVIISRLRHKNLVRLLGWCYTESQLLLVYEYMPNGSLDKHLFNSDGTCEILDWNCRYNIICGIASALVYLHSATEQQVQVIHRDIKSSNVMLDSQFNARLGKVVEQNCDSSYTTSVLAGTPGYMAPECLHTGKATVESDVYSFGTVLLEIASGRKPNSALNKHLVDFVWNLHAEDEILNSVDPKLQNYDEDEMMRVLLLGLACCHPNPLERPNTRSIERILAKNAPLPHLPPQKPAFMWPVPSYAMSCTNHGFSSSSDFSVH